MNKFVIDSRKNGVQIGHFSHLDGLAGIRHGISTRVGGVSSHPYNSLNLGLHTGDNVELVNKNRRLFCEAVGVSFADTVTAEQTHGDTIAVIDYRDAGKGHDRYDDAIRNTDAFITDCPNLPLMLFFADCVPILIVDPVKTAIGISHAGWKGTVSKIAQKTVLMMRERYGTTPSDCLIGVGPSIGPCCYEVDEPVIERLRENFDDWRRLAKPSTNNRWHLDLWQTNKSQLIEIGVKSDNIVISGVCTSCNTGQFFSHRAEGGKAGRLGALIAIE